jgi:DNA-binding phage protein
MQNAKANGRKLGRPRTTKDDIPAVFYKHYPAYVAKQMNVSELARVCGLSRPTIYKYLKMVS